MGRAHNGGGARARLESWAERQSARYVGIPKQSRFRSRPATSSCPLCGRDAWMAGWKGRALALSASSVRAATTSAVRATLRARETASEPTDVISCVPLIKANPSFACSVIGLRPNSRRMAAASP